MKSGRGNPVAFVAGPAVWGDAFFGRTETLRHLASRLQSGTSSLLVGQRRIGKSSILAQLTHLQGQGELPGIDVAPIVVSLDGNLFSGDNAADELSRALVASTLKSAEDQRPSVATSLKRLKRQQVTPWEVVDFFGRLRGEGLFVLLLFDEIDSALRLSRGEVGLLLRALVSQGHLVAVVTSFLWPDEIGIETPAASPWFNVFSVDTLGPLEPSESLEMLQVLSSRSGYRLSEPECLFLIDVLGNHPFYLQAAGFRLYAHHAYATLHDSQRPASLRKAVSNLFGEMEWHLRYIVDHLLHADLEVLKSVASGKRPNDIRALARLNRFGLVAREEGRWQVTSGMMREFVVALSHRSAGERIRESTVWKGFAGVARQAFEVAVEKAVGAAAGKYLG